MAHKTTRREAIGLAAAAAATLSGEVQKKVTRYVRFRRNGTTAHGILDGDTVRELRGELLGKHAETGTKHKLGDVKLLHPIEPPKILAVGLNYKSHLGSRPAPSNPEIFYKPISALLNPGEPIVIPKTATNVHYEGELVVVIGTRAKSVPVESAKSHVFGVTAGNDVSERGWQKADLQWFRAKATDTFGPLGPAIVTGLNYDDLLLQTRLNGEVVQSQRTKDLIFDVATIVSYVSKYVTLEPGDVIFTGTPGTTRAFKVGDTIEVVIEGIGTLRNKAVKGS